MDSICKTAPQFLWINRIWSIIWLLQQMYTSSHVSNVIRNFHTSIASIHLQKYGKFTCRICDIPFLTTQALNSHIDEKHAKQKVYKCVYENRRILYIHQATQHGGNKPEEPPFPTLILEHDNENPWGWTKERAASLLIICTGDIKKSEVNAWKSTIPCTMAIGLTLPLVSYCIIHKPGNTVIMFHTTTVRFSNYLFESRILMVFIFWWINWQALIFSNKLEQWSPAFITNVQYLVYTWLPDNIRSNRNIKTMYIDSKTGKPYIDNLCLLLS